MDSYIDGIWNFVQILAAACTSALIFIATCLASLWLLSKAVNLYCQGRRAMALYKKWGKVVDRIRLEENKEPEIEEHGLQCPAWLADRPLDGWWNGEYCARILPAYVDNGNTRYLVVMEALGGNAPEVKYMTCTEIQDTLGIDVFSKTMLDYNDGLIRYATKSDTPNPETPDPV